MEINKITGYYVDYKDEEYIRLNEKTWLLILCDGYELVSCIKDVFELERIFLDERKN